MMRRAIQPIKLNFQRIRKERQENNVKAVQTSIETNNRKMFHQNINKNELKRILDRLGLTEEELFEKCSLSSILCETISSLLSKQASRQGILDEKKQLETVDLIAKQCGTRVENLPPTAFRSPKKKPGILSKNELKERNISKEDCLKSYDGKISGKMNGFISSKISFGKGGGQDTQFREQELFANWWIDYQPDEKLVLVLLIDTDLTELFNRIKEKYEKVSNIMVFNHFEFQQYIIDSYSIDSS